MKSDIKIEKSITFNCGNFSNVKPTVSITLKDIEVNDKLDKVISLLSDLVDNSFMKELHSQLMILEGNDCSKGSKKVIAFLESIMDEVGENTKEVLDKLIVELGE